MVLAEGLGRRRRQYARQQRRMLLCEKRKKEKNAESSRRQWAGDAPVCEGDAPVCKSTNTSAMEIVPNKSLSLSLPLSLSARRFKRLGTS
jgi:hypothetical protein